MSAGLNREFIEEHYRQMGDEELLRAVTKDANGLTPVAIEVIEGELGRRKLGAQASKGLAAQNKQHTMAEIDAYCELLQKLPCPVCGQTLHKLNGGSVAVAASFLVATSYSVDNIIACPNCLDELSNKAQAKTALLGWWGIPWGPVRTAQAFDINRQSKRLHHAPGPNKYLRGFTLNHIGEVEMYRDNPEKLSSLIA